MLAAMGDLVLFVERVDVDCDQSLVRARSGPERPQRPHTRLATRRSTIPLLGDVMTALGIRFEWHDEQPRDRDGERPGVTLPRGPGSAAVIPATEPLFCSQKLQQRACRRERAHCPPIWRAERTFLMRPNRHFRSGVETRWRAYPRWRAEDRRVPRSRGGVIRAIFRR